MAQTGNGSIKDSLTVNCDTTITEPKFMIQLGGDPHKNVFTGTTATGKTVTSVSTANWSAYGGSDAYVNNGMTGGIVWNYAPNVMKESWFSYNANGSNIDTFKISKPKFISGGWDTSKTYTITMTGSLGSGWNGFSDSTEMRVLGNVMNGPDTVRTKLNISNKAVFVSKPDANGKFTLFVNAMKGQGLGVISGFTIIQNGFNLWVMLALMGAVFRRKSVLVAGLFALTIPLQAQKLKPGFNNVYIQARFVSGGSYVYVNRPCVIWTPSDWDSTSAQQYPVIISYHGSGEAGTDTVSVKNEGILRSIVRGFPAQTFFGGVEVKFVVVAPQDGIYSADTTWWVPNYNDLTARLMLSTGGIVKMDSSRVYLTGYSAGGRGSVGNTDLAGPTTDTVYSSYIAATVPMAPATQDITFANLALAVPRVIHWLSITGANDQTYYNQAFRVQDTIQKYSTLFPLADTISGSGHCCWNLYWDSTYLVPGFGKNIYQWLLQWNRGSGSTPPNVSAGNTQTITLPTTSLTLTGTASGNNGATIASTAWTFVSGPVTPTITSPAQLVTTVTGMSSAGNYAFKLTATDNNGLTNNSTVTDTVNSAAPPPIVSAGGTYQFDTYSYNGGIMLNVTESTGNTHMKYNAVAAAYYYSNDKTTQRTSTGGEPKFVGIKGANSLHPWVIQMRLPPGDSTRICKVGVTGTDTVTNLSSTDTAIIILRYPVDYPPQNTDGSAGGHRATVADCTNFFGPTCTPGKDWVMAASGDPIKIADGTTRFIDIFSNHSTDSFHVAPGYHLWFYPGTYKKSRIIFDTVGSAYGPLGDTTQAPIIIDGLNKVVFLDGFYISNVRNVEFKNFKVDNHYQSTAGFSYQFDGMSTAWVNIHNDTSVRGNFSGLVAKFEYADLPNPSTHYQVFWSRIQINNMFIKDCHGEDIYGPGSANSPATFVINSNISNNISLFSGNKLFKTLDLYSNDTVSHNVGYCGSINYGSPFETNVSIGMEHSLINNGNLIFDNLIVGFGNQGLNSINGFRGTTPLALPDNRIYNNVFLHSWGPIGSFFAQQDSFATFRLDSNYFGLHGPFNFGQIYGPGALGTNTNNQIYCLPSGTLPGGATRSLYVITNTIYDSTKFTLNAGDARFSLTNNTIIKKLAFPQFVSAPFQSVFPEQWIDLIFSMWGDEYPGQTTKQGQPKYYQIGDIVKWFDKFYVSNINNNTNHVPSGGTDAFWTLLTWNGSTTPPIDPRLYTTDPYAQRGIGLLQQVAPNGQNCGCIPGNKPLSKVFTPGN
ncbi:MAG TPA: hypothetical protein VGZ90_13685 [Puia sp.]|nr:hypothetical protein [Puia sp.]